MVGPKGYFKQAKISKNDAKIIISSADWFVVLWKNSYLQGWRTLSTQVLRLKLCQRTRKTCVKS